MFIVDPILERDINLGETIGNAAEIIGNNWNIIGKHRENHIPRVGDFNENSYSMKEILGILCLRLLRKDRCQYLLWEAASVELAFGSKGAEIVFNPYATVGELSKLMWLIEAHNAAIANGYFVGSINRVGTGSFPNPFASGDGKPQHTDFGHFYGSSYSSAPDASCTPSLSPSQRWIAGRRHGSQLL